MADIFSSHPYPGRKDIRPTIHHCTACNKSIAFKDKQAHERGKKHKQIVAGIIKATTAEADGTDSGDYGFDQPAKGGTGCHNCGGNHLARDCTEPRRDSRECHNCKKAGHLSKECPEPRVQTCRNCLQNGHIAKECTEPRNFATVQCKNCDQFGHFGRDCPEPKDWSKVICNQCGQAGHTVKRCTNEPVAPVVDDNTPIPAAEGNWMSGEATTAVEGDWANGGGNTAVEGDWATATPAADTGASW